ncbi:hypothetical protein [Chryseobacterium sp. OV279]|uniref:hypothetical protein n=1 Tax=Chryseobacterium sp. OV279 TaxID=1500285 RepID=UPI000648511E|nr:hypothetical protein [Chryseobacterium sp. OV279]SHE54473.1 hypothetical protein SAMN02787100_0305 [Chryseobacterium sp. OV279]
MFFNDDAKEISAIIKSYNKEILLNFIKIHINAVSTTRNEIQYFRTFFPALETYLNSVRIPSVYFTCRTREIHGKPMVTFGSRNTCELGDYFIVVKYIKNNILIGQKTIIYQLKRSHTNSWKIDQRQLNFLKNWPSFNFGRTQNGSNSFRLRPTRPEYGSYVLINDLDKGLHESNIYGTAYDIHNNQEAGRIQLTNKQKFYYCSLLSYFNLMTWENGEPIIQNTDIGDFNLALYRYMGWEQNEDDEFKNFNKKNSEESFWGIELTIGTEQKE